jgi:aryl-alcohol dehydrogenase-like predicted oxidoreductase
METVNLGRTGLKVARLCLGTMIFGTQLDEGAAGKVMDAALELGIDFFDTADAYPVPPSLESAGRTEEIVGRWLRGRRDRVVLATKCVGRVGPGANDQGGSRKHVLEACERSLRRLQTDRIDLYYLHHPDLGAPMDEAFEALDQLRRDGKILYPAVSNFEAWQMALAMEAIAAGRLARIAAHQPRYNLLHRPFERELLRLCRAAGIAVVPYNPLGGGMLTGRYRRGAPPPEESRFARGDWGRMYQGRYWHDPMFQVADVVVEVARAEGWTPAQVALGWLLAKDGVTSAIVGASRPEQLHDAAGAVGRRLGPESLARLDDVSRPFVSAPA